MAALKINGKTAVDNRSTLRYGPNVTERWVYSLNTDTISRRNPETGWLEVRDGIDDPDDPNQYSGWYAELAIDDTSEVPEVVALTLRAGVHPYHQVAEHVGTDLSGLEEAECPPLTARLLRAVPLGRLRAIANLHLAARHEVRGRLPDPTRARRRDASYFAAWAAHYTRIVASSRRPIADLAEKFGEDRDHVRDAIHACRERGFLTKGTAGVPGGQLTSKALKALGRS
jgi:hypothetical protein